MSWQIVDYVSTHTKKIIVKENSIITTVAIEVKRRRHWRDEPEYLRLWKRMLDGSELRQTARTMLDKDIGCK